MIGKSDREMIDTIRWAGSSAEIWDQAKKILVLYMVYAQ